MLPKPPSDSTSKQEDAKAVQGCNGVNTEASAIVSGLKDPSANEENSQYPAHEEGHVAVTNPVAMEEATLSYPLEFEKYWKAAQENPHDFTAWTELLQYVEQEVGRELSWYMEILERKGQNEQCVRWHCLLGVYNSTKK